MARSLSDLATEAPRVRRLISWPIRRPVLALSISVLAIALSLVGLKTLVRDPSVDAFIPKDHPSYLASERAKAVFGLSDPIVVGLFWDTEGAAFRVQNLALLSRLHSAIEGLPNVRYKGVTSLASEGYVNSDPDASLVSRYVPNERLTAEDAEKAHLGWQRMAPHVGTLAAADASAAAILIELEDGRQAAQTYQDVMRLTDAVGKEGLSIHIAGLGAVVGHLSDTIARDVRSLVPLIYVVVLLTILVAFRSVRAVLVPLPVTLGAVAGSLGLMALLDIPYFAITSALPVIVVAIAVADTIYILSAYQESLARDADEDLRTHVLQAMLDVIRPITLTTITTCAGFAAIGLASIMPPITYFAWFAAVGVALAWFYSVLSVPALIVLLKLRLGAGERIGKPLRGLSSMVHARPAAALTTAALLVVFAAIMTSQMRIDRSLVSSFPEDSPIRLADLQLNRSFSGTAFLDVMLTAPTANGLLRPDAMGEIVELQSFMETLPHVRKTVAVTDYVGQLERALEDHGDSTGRRVPQNADTIAQYLFLYESSATPDALREEITANHQQALVRGVLNTRWSSEERAAVEALQDYVDARFPSEATGLRATLSGRVNTRYHWMSRLGWSHVSGVLLSLAFVLIVSALLLRSVRDAGTAVVPVVVSVLGLYAVMALTRTPLEPATSMFAAISIGIGVDYALHLSHRIRSGLQTGMDLSSVTRIALSTTGRACFFNAVALGCGFLVLAASGLNTLKNFAILIATSAFASFIAAFLIVPLIFRLRERGRILGGAASGKAAILLASCCLLPGVGKTDVTVDEQALNFATKISEREDGSQVRRIVDMKLISSSGAVRERRAIVVRARDETRRNALIVFASPNSIRDTAFLSHETFDADAVDSRWLFVPAAGRVRRLPAADRGDYFLGTDFTYADIEAEFKFDLDDYEFFDFEEGTGQGGEAVVRLTGRPRTPQLAGELGYGSFVAEVDRKTLIPRRIEFTDPSGRRLKTIHTVEIGEADGIFFVRRVEVVNHRTQHRTQFHYRDVSFEDEADFALFSPSRLRRGLSARL